MSADKDDLYRKQMQIIGRGVRSHLDGVRKSKLTPEMEDLLKRLDERERDIAREISSARNKKH